MDLVQKHKLMLFPRLNKWIAIVFVLAVIVGGFRSYQLYQYIFKPNINTPGSIIIPLHATYEQVSLSMPLTSKFWIV